VAAYWAADDEGFVMPSKIRVGLIGCGQIADAHLQEIRRISRAELVAVCDQHLDLARQASARFGGPPVFDDLGDMLGSARPDVLHVTTPPQTHREVALRALGAGVSVYLEKPFAVDAAEAGEILDAARAAGRLVCVGHDQLLDPTWLECRRLVRSGAIGRVVHVESVQGYTLDGPFGRAFASEPDHWVRRLPGGLFQNTISHALYRITDLLSDSQPRVWASWFGAPPRGGFPTELRVVLQGAEMTGALAFTAAARPVQRVARVFGTRQGLEVDLDAGLIRRYRAPRLPGALAKVEAPLADLGEAARSSAANIWKLLRYRLHYFAGMRCLFEAFYRAVADDGEPPIPYEEIFRVTAIMDEIFACCHNRVENHI
jgi:predicted dehydrogenase